MPSNSRVFRNRQEAGQALAEVLRPLCGTPDLLVLGIPRGGLPVAFEVAKVLQAPLDIFVVRKLGVPSDPEFAMGAIASGGVRVLHHDTIAMLHITPDVFDAVACRELAELQRRETVYRGANEPPDFRNKTLLLVDDGIATGATTKAAIQALKKHHPARLLLAVPTAPASAYDEIQPLVDGFVVLSTPEPFHAVAQSYAEFPQTTDAEVTNLLKASKAWSTK